MVFEKPLVLYSTLSRRKEEFHPICEGKVGMYVCGVTVYDYCHIGHGRTFVAFDVIRRWLEARGYEVTFVRNITDIDDKIIRRAAENGESTKELTERFTREMQADMAALGCLPPTHEPRATEFIGAMLELIGKLEKRGLAYVGANGDVDYAVRRFPGYGKLSGRSVDELRSGARVGVEASKKDPLDFVLWKQAKPGEPHWSSPWGEGRPGWHIECSAMSAHFLGENFDIHGGGPDLIFPHHENEIAQSEGASGKPFANYWMHSGPLRVRAADGTEQKMSKSLNNFWTIRDALSETDGRYGEGNGAEVLRYFLMRTHYRSPISFNPQLIEDAHKALTRLYESIAGKAGDSKPLDWTEPHAAAFAAAMDDDFNTPVALATLFDLASEINRTGDPAAVRQLLGLGDVLNILKRDPAAFLKGSTKGIDESEVVALIEKRAACKRAKDYAGADAIRQQLLDNGIALKDTPAGTEWRRV